ncbi:MAG: zinc-binding alcohol dehydrogenase family protein [Polyangiaceae bacterium]
MRAALVSDFKSPPRFGSFEPPTVELGEERIEVSAAALSPLVRITASGAHYAAGSQLPFVPGVDGVGRDAQGRRVYFAFPRAPFGSLAEVSVADRSCVIELPEGVSDVTAAALANPGMSSWAALTRRAAFLPGETVLVNGATGASGRVAVQIARHLGAKRIIATGRNQRVLASVGADEIISLNASDDAITAALLLGRERGVDVVLDYLWGKPASLILRALAGSGRREAEPRVRFVAIGGSAGPSIELPSALLRKSGIELMGSGIGSVPMTDLVASIGEMLTAIGGSPNLPILEVPLAEVEAAWSQDTGEQRLVFRP